MLEEWKRPALFGPPTGSDRHSAGLLSSVSGGASDDLRAVLRTARAVRPAPRHRGGLMPHARAVGSLGYTIQVQRYTMSAWTERYTISDRRWYTYETTCSGVSPTTRPLP